MSEKHTIHAHAKCRGVDCEIKREFVLKDITQFDGPMDIRYLQRKLSAAGYMRKAARVLLDELGTADLFFMRETATALEKALAGYLNCVAPASEGDSK